jgi:hypothetical protein
LSTVRRALALAGCAVFAAACGSAQNAGSRASLPRGNFTLAEARAFDDFPLYWAGERVDGLPLVAVLRRADTAKYVSFVYGDCTPAVPDQGCAPPAEVQVWPGSGRSLESYDSSVPGTPVPESATVRGRPAAFFDDGTRLEIYAGPATVVVFSQPRARVLEIARALRCLQASGRAPPGPLSC